MGISFRGLGFRVLGLGFSKGVHFEGTMTDTMKGADERMGFRELGFRILGLGSGSRLGFFGLGDSRSIPVEIWG